MSDQPQTGIDWNKWLPWGFMLISVLLNAAFNKSQIVIPPFPAQQCPCQAAAK